MTLIRTIRRRHMRQRARARALRPAGPPLISLDWLMREAIDQVRAQLKIADLFNQTYREPRA